MSLPWLGRVTLRAWRRGSIGRFNGKVFKERGYWQEGGIRESPGARRRGVKAAIETVAYITRFLNTKSSSGED